jgi:hypothetical protein
MNQFGLDLDAAPDTDLHSNNMLFMSNVSATSLSSGTEKVSTPLFESNPPQDENQHIATLLGDHMPLPGIPAAGEGASSSSAPDMAFSHFMSLRLLLLRSAAKRSPEENEMLDIIKKSFRGYSVDKSRSDKDLAFLLVRDWQFLTATMESKKPAAQPNSGEYTSHVMDAPAVNTFSSSGTPAAMPNSLSYIDSTKVGKLSKDTKKTASRRRISSSDEAEARYRSINVVDEN